jgi:hypothetical protein
MRRTYNVYDCVLKKTILEDVMPSAIFKSIGMNSRMVCRYADGGMLYHQRYKFDICREMEDSSCSPFICVYDLRDGEYITSNATAKEISEKYGIQEKTVEQYASSSKVIRGTWLLFRADNIPVNKLLSEELAKKWEEIANKINPRRKERQAG